MNLLFFILFVCSATAASALMHKLTVPAALTGGALAALIYTGVGWPGIALMGAFFALGTLATSQKKKTKQRMGLAENQGGRTVWQVLANGGAAGLLGLTATFFPNLSVLCLLLMAAAFSSAAADTVSSELGSVYGKKFYDVLSFKKSSPGPDGVVSAEGIVFGIAASVVMAAVYGVNVGWSKTLIWTVIAGTVGNLADSYLGATLERKGLIGNNAVNFLNTAIAVVTGLLLQKF